MTLPASTRQARRPDPKEYRFNDEDRERYQKRVWQAPRSIARTERDGDEAPGLWARLWRADGTVRGGGAVTSLLPVLAVHTWPGKRNMDGANAGTEAEAGWTAWTYLPGRRRLARLSGINKDTVKPAVARLKALGLMQTRSVAKDRHKGGVQTFYRLSAVLYARGDEKYARFPANLFYGGTWAVLPTNAARHLYTVLACVDPIGDEDSYLAKIDADHNDRGAWWDLYDEDPQRYEPYFSKEYKEGTAEALLRRDFLGTKARRRRSLTELQRLSGLTRGTLVEALRILTGKMHGGFTDPRDGKVHPPVPLIAKGAADPREPTWHGPDQRALTWYFYPEFLNDRTKLQQLRRERWPLARPPRPAEASPRRTGRPCNPVAARPPRRGDPGPTQSCRPADHGEGDRRGGRHLAEQGVQLPADRGACDAGRDHPGEGDLGGPGPAQPQRAVRVPQASARRVPRTVPGQSRGEGEGRVRVVR